MKTIAKSAYIKPGIFSGFPELTTAQSTRHGGVSPGELGSLNLSFYTPDDPDAVRENQGRFIRLLGWAPDRVASSRQVHGQEVRKVEKPEQVEGYDALITDKPGILLAVTVADCTPILLYDPVSQVIGAVHSGWPGTRLKVLEKTLMAMRENFHCNPTDIHAWVGVCIGKEDYEVDADVADHFAPQHKRWDEVRKKFFLDLKKANRDQLLRQGVPKEQIEASPLSTASHSEDFFSHRASKGKAGRGWAVIGVMG